MVSQTNEQALESAIEKCLAGISTEELKEGLSQQSLGAGYFIGAASDFNMQYAIDERFFWQFLQKTQEVELAKLQKNTPSDWQRKLLERFDRLIKKHGILHLLKKGLSVDDAHFNLLYPAPLASSSEKVKQNFADNVFSCTRQVRYSMVNPLQEIDMVLFINGIPLITLELKNAWTGQTARYHGQKQYRDDRDATQPLLTFGRCLVHMAVDTDEVYMTTKLSGSSTFFLPFNKVTILDKATRRIHLAIKRHTYGKKYSLKTAWRILFSILCVWMGQAKIHYQSEPCSFLDTINWMW